MSRDRRGSTTPSRQSPRMRARVLALLALALLVPAIPPAGAATTSYVPGLVLDGTVPAFVSGTVAGAEVTLTLGAAPATAPAPPSYVPGLVRDGPVPAFVPGTVAGAEVTLTIGDAAATQHATGGSVTV